MNLKIDDDWLKSKGYLHITPKIDVVKHRTQLIKKIRNIDYVSRYSFFPLIHSVIKERRYKKISENTSLRKHSYLDKGKVVRTAKSRPLHYASHMDALIFGYYAKMINQKYEDKLKCIEGLSECIIAYRKIKLEESDKNKGTIHFAHEVFEKIKERSEPECIVLKFDIKSFFNRIDHSELKSAWADLFGFTKKMRPDHYNVFKAATRFSYILRDDFRIKTNTNSGRRSGFDEKELALTRNKFGIQGYFETLDKFKEAIKSKSIKIHKSPFRNEEGKVVGIPQGLPISAVLANLYLLKFDMEIYNSIVLNKKGFYRRYSDDIIIICKRGEEETINNIVITAIEKCKVEISTEKTETFLFKKYSLNGGGSIIKSIKMLDNISKINFPLTYLGFEFYGHRTAIKSSNLAKFYRRMIFTVKRKVKRAAEIAKRNPEGEVIIYRNQLFKLYTLLNLSATKLKTRIKWIEPDLKGGYILKSKIKESKYKSNYLNYVSRAARIMKEDRILKQIRRHRYILNQALSKHLKKLADY